MRHNLGRNVFVSWCRHIFGYSKLKSLSSCCLGKLICTNEGLVVDTKQTKYGFFFPTLDGLASMLRPGLSMNFIHSIFLTAKIGSGFPLFRKTILEVRKKYPAVIGKNPKKKICFLCYPKL